MKSCLGFSVLALGFVATELAAANPPGILPTDDFTCPVLASCSSAPPATVTFRDLQFWQAALPGALVTWPSHDPCESPRATCSAPQATQVMLVSNVVFVEESPESAPLVDSLLEIWERQSRERAPISDRDRRWVERMSQPNLSAHALDLALPLSGPVTMSDLQQRFAWKLESSSRNESRLVAVPLDETQRLFCPALKITLSRSPASLIAMEVSDKSSNWVPVLLPPANEQASRNSAEQIERGLPPSPSPVARAVSVPLIRFAAGIVEIEDGPQ